MADPITIFAGMAILGGVVSAVGASMQAQRESAAHEFNALLSDRNARVARSQAAMDADIQRRQAFQHLGSIRAAYGASGVTPEGSPLDILELSATNAERDNQMILYRGELRAMGFTDTATLDRMGARSAEQEGTFRSASELLTGFSGGARLYTAGRTPGTAGTPISVGS